MSDLVSAVAATIDEAIVQLRSTIYELGLTGGELGIRARVASLLRELTVVAGFEVHSSFSGPVDSVISEVIAEHLLATVREAVTNVGRHARATHASLRLSAASDSACSRSPTTGADWEHVKAQRADWDSTTCDAGPRSSVAASR